MASDIDLSEQKQSRSHLGPPLLRRFLAVFCFASLSALLWVALQHRHQNAERTRLKNKFKIVSIGLHNFSDTYGSLPYPIRYEDGTNGCHPSLQMDFDRPLYSWRVSAIPFTGLWGGNTPRPSFRFDLSWHEQDPYFTRAQVDTYTYSDSGDTDYSPHAMMMALTGPGTAFGDGKESPKSISDLDSDTILLVEVANSGIHWADPGDLNILELPRTINDESGKGISCRNQDGFLIAFADGAIWSISEDVPFDDLAKFFTVDGAKQHDRDKILSAYRIK